MSDWIILRCGGKSTLTLADTLTKAGYEVWTPIERRKRLAGRDRKLVEQANALMPSFIFADAARSHELLALSRDNKPFRVWDSEERRMVTKGHPHFSLFRHDGRFPVVGDAALTALRRAEARTAPKQAVRVFRLGHAVKLVEGGFAGLDGRVEGTRGQFTFVKFAGFPVAVQISTALLHEAIDGESPLGLNDGVREVKASKAA